VWFVDGRMEVAVVLTEVEGSAVAFISSTRSATTDTETQEVDSLFHYMVSLLYRVNVTEV